MNAEQIAEIPLLVTQERIEAIIVKEDYFLFPGSTLTIAMLTLANGYIVTGEAACANPDIFNEELGRKYARVNAKNKIWELEGYLLRQKMTEQYKTADREFLFSVLGEIVSRIERCGASLELTSAVSLAFDLKQAIGNQWNPANPYALERVCAELEQKCA